MIASKVSIIVSNFNKANYVSETIQSVINQTNLNWELLIIDDGSSDDSVNIIESFSIKDIRIQLFTLFANHGANYCRNYGLKRSHGQYVIFLDADDLLSPKCLANRIDFIENTDLDFCVFTLEVFKNNIGDLKRFWKPNSKQPLKDFLSHNLPWQTMQPIWRKGFLNRIGGFDETFERLQDVELHTRALLINDVQFDQVCSTPDCFYRVDEVRKNYDSFEFLNRWVSSAVKYYLKFNKQINDSNYLIGTIYHTYNQILFQYKSKLITQKDFSLLEKTLFDEKLELSSFHKFLFILVKKVNLLPFRIIGFNYVMRKLIVI